MASDIQMELLSAIRALEARFVFDELAAERDLLRAPSRFQEATGEDLGVALELAVDENTLRGIEMPRGRFLLVRTEKTLSENSQPSFGPRDFTNWRPPRAEISAASLEAALAVPPETVALRRAIVDETQFAWPTEDYLALLEVATARPNREELNA